MKLLLLAGDGIGPEIMNQAIKLLDLVKPSISKLSISSALIGGASYDQYGKPITEQTLVAAKAADAVLLAAVGGPKWDPIERENRPERALLTLRNDLDLFANLRPASCYASLVDASSLKRSVIENLDLLIIRELVSGIYFGKPRGIDSDEKGKFGYNTLYYHEDEIRRIAHIAFQSAMKRNKKVTSIDKHNVLEVMELWREVVSEVAKDYPEVSLNHLYVDNAAMQLVSNPKQFDVIVTGNLFGDILSDLAAELTGSIGMLPSASLNSQNQGMFEPVHGSAPDIAGQDKANPIAMILSLAMAFKYSLNQIELAEKIETAVQNVIDRGFATADFANSNTEPNKKVGTNQMGDLIADEFESLIH